jgi:hypothetical protein
VIKSCDRAAGDCRTGFCSAEISTPTVRGLGSKRRKPALVATSTLHAAHQQSISQNPGSSNRRAGFDLLFACGIPAFCAAIKGNLSSGFFLTNSILEALQSPANFVRLLTNGEKR